MNDEPMNDEPMNDELWMMNDELITTTHYWLLIKLNDELSTSTDYSLLITH